MKKDDQDQTRQSQIERAAEPTPEGAAERGKLVEKHAPQLIERVGKRVRGADAEDIAHDLVIELLYDRNFFHKFLQSGRRFRDYLAYRIRYGILSSMGKRGKRRGRVREHALFEDDQNAAQPRAQQGTPADDYAAEEGRRLVNSCWQRTKDYYVASNRGDLFTALVTMDPGPEGTKRFAREWGMAVEDVKQERHELRTKYREYFTQEARQANLSLGELATIIRELPKAML